MALVLGRVISTMSGKNESALKLCEYILLETVCKGNQCRYIGTHLYFICQEIRSMATANKNNELSVTDRVSASLRRESIRFLFWL
jgi:hypothetical protein